MPTFVSRIRRRTTPPKGTGQFTIGLVSTRGNTTQPWTPFQYRVCDSPLLWNMLEYTTDEIHSGPPYIVGGPFTSLKYKIDPFHFVGQGYGTYMRSDFLWKYVGVLGPPAANDWAYYGTSEFDFAAKPVATLLSETSSNIPSMAGLGDKAWSRTKPKLEQADGFVFLREGKEIPKMLKTSAKLFHETWKESGGSQRSWIMNPRKVSDHFLNHQFGWMPFIRDLRKFDNVIQNSGKIMKDLTSRNGQWTRQRATLKSETTNTYLGQRAGCFTTGQSFTGSQYTYPPYSTTEWSKEVVEKTTAVGSFKYYRPEFDATNEKYFSAWNTAMRYVTIGGFRVSPSNLYKSTPWTWAIDWMSNVGDHVDYLSDIWMDSLANKYLYVMQHKTSTLRIKTKIPGIGGSQSFEWSRSIESKQRAEGNSPYGFNLSGSLTPRQLAIATALGVTRTKVKT
jgi:hypothetical protein